MSALTGRVLLFCAEPFLLTGGAHSDRLQVTWVPLLEPLQIDGGGSRQCQIEFCVLSATVKERAPVLLVVAPANGRSQAPTSATAKNVTAVANGVAMYVVGSVKSNYLPPSLRPLSMDCFIWKTLEDISQQTRHPLLQASRMGISRVVSVWKRKGAPGGKAAAQRSRALVRQSRAFDWHQFFDFRFWPLADMS